MSAEANAGASKMAKQCEDLYRLCLHGQSVRKQYYRGMVEMVFDQTAAPLRAAIEKRIAAGHNESCEIKFRSMDLPCTCGHSDLLSQLELLKGAK